MSKLVPISPYGNKTVVLAGAWRAAQPDSILGISEVVTITSAQLLALNATPQTIMAAPDAGKILLPEFVIIHKPAGTAYSGIAGGEDLALNYTSNAGLQLASCETTGFLDQATAQTRIMRAYRAASGVSDITPAAAAALILQLLVGEITTGNSPLYVQTFYRLLPNVILP